VNPGQLGTWPPTEDHDRAEQASNEAASRLLDFVFADSAEDAGALAREIWRDIETA
jgi:hypothetical protein